MQFTTKTSTYEITKERDNLFKLKKVSVNEGYSMVTAGMEFYAGANQIYSFINEDGDTQLVFGNMNTSGIKNYEELNTWLKENGIPND